MAENLRIHRLNFHVIPVIDQYTLIEQSSLIQHFYFVETIMAVTFSISGRLPCNLYTQLKYMHAVSS